MNNAASLRTSGFGQDVSHPPGIPRRAAPERCGYSFAHADLHHGGTLAAHAGARRVRAAAEADSHAVAVRGALGGGSARDLAGVAVSAGGASGTQAGAAGVRTCAANARIL